MTSREKIAKLKEERTEKIGLTEAEYNPQIEALYKTFTQQMLIDAGWGKFRNFVEGGDYASEFIWVKENTNLKKSEGTYRQIRFSEKHGYVLTNTNLPVRRICDEEDLEYYFKTGQ